MNEHFEQNGWVVLNLKDASLVLQIRQLLEEKLKELLGQQVSLEEYHKYAEDDSFHSEIQFSLCKIYRERKLGPKVIQKNLALFIELLGPDLSVQANPYLRITRPGKPQDNVGYHRDTFYGGSPYELSVLIPFVDISAASSLSVLSGSHIESEDAYPTTQTVSSDVKKGSAKHQLGFLYAPKLMDEGIESKMEPIPLKVGQALVFSLSIVHGSRLNTGLISRWSSDIRIMNAMAPVDLSARPDYYQPLSESVVTKTAKKFLHGKNKRDQIELELCDTAFGK